MNTELIARLRAEAAITATLAGVWGEYAIQSVRRGSKNAGDEAAYAFRRGNRSLDLSAAADELERLERHVVDSERLRMNCHATYNGGHHDEPAYSAFHHGMDTVCNVLKGHDEATQ